MLLILYNSIAFLVWKITEVLPTNTHLINHSYTSKIQNFDTPNSLT